MAEKKSILEEALVDIKNIQDALNANTKEILRSVAREEIDSVVKESILKEEDYEEEDLEATDTDLNLEPTGAEETGEEGKESLEGVLDDINGSEEVAPEMEPEMGMNADALGGEEMDMTAASDDEVIAIYKKLSGEDEVEIVGDEIHLNISEPGEYVVKANDSVIGDESAPTDDLVPVPTGDEIEGGEESGVDYEIEMGDETEGGEEPTPDDLVPAGDEIEGGEEEEEEEIDETLAVTRGYAGRQGAKKSGSGHLPSPKESLDEAIKAKKLVSETTKKYNALLVESTKLKAENEDFRKALKQFRNQLVETVVFNSNLTYTTRLFMEHSTTKAEKQDIIKRFDNEVSNLVESKKLYKTIVNELESRKPINESVENKIIKEVTTSTSKQLIESTAYADPSTKRIIDLMKRVENK